MMKRARALLRRLFTASSASRAERTIRITPAVLYLIGIFVVSSIPGKDVRAFADDRIEHFLEYFGLGVLLLIAVASFGSIQRLKLVSGSWLFGALYALSDEVHQMFVPGRQPSWNDVLFDVLGLTAAMIGIVVALKPMLKPAVKPESPP